MRKDVRLGFAVGGVLLAVIVVAVLVLHRSPKQDNTVVIDKTGQGATGDDTAINVAPNASGQPSGVQQPPSDSEKHGTPLTTTDPPAPHHKNAASAWDQLFATGPSPVSDRTTKKDPDAAPDQSAEHPGGAVANSSIELQPRHDAAPSTSGAAVDQPTTRPSANSATTHKIRPGDTFVTISREVYGDGKYFQAIQKANPSVNPNRLKPGMVIKLPALSEVQQPRAQKASAKIPASTAPALSADGTTYTVQSGDSLYKISHELYGKDDRQGDLYILNKDLIGSDPRKLRVGMVLKLPEKPTAVAAR